MSADCIDNGDNSYTCSGDGPGFGAYVIYSYSEDTILGCTDIDACNYDSSAELNDGSCLEYDDYSF